MRRGPALLLVFLLRLFPPNPPPVRRELRPLKTGCNNRWMHFLGLGAGRVESLHSMSQNREIGMGILGLGYDSVFLNQRDCHNLEAAGSRGVDGAKRRLS